MAQSNPLEEAFGLTGQYRIEEEIGSGGMDAVFRAVQLGLDRQVAVKILKASDVVRVLASTRAFMRENPACGEPFIIFGWTHFRFVEERRGRRGKRRDINESTDLFVGAFTGADELGGLEDWQLWEIACKAYKIRRFDSIPAGIALGSSMAAGSPSLERRRQPFRCSAGQFC